MRHHLLLLAFLPLGLIACPQAHSPNPSPPPDSDLCAAMCQHIGPTSAGGLGCPEGDPVYDSDLPGPPDVPNKSCLDFCKGQQTNGIFLNPRCVIQVKTCAEIEDARKKTCK